MRSPAKKKRGQLGTLRKRVRVHGPFPNSARWGWHGAPQAHIANEQQKQAAAALAEKPKSTTKSAAAAGRLANCACRPKTGPLCPSHARSHARAVCLRPQYWKTRRQRAGWNGGGAFQSLQVEGQVTNGAQMKATEHRLQNGRVRHLDGAGFFPSCS